MSLLRLDRRLTIAAAAFCCGCAPTGGYRITPVPADQTLEERIVIRESPWVAEKIAIIDLDGTLENQAEPSLLGGAGENPVSLAVEKLDAAAHDPDVRAVVLRINSPGGTVTASDILYQEIRHFRESTRKPVVAMCLDVTASGGYYAACAADEIVAERTSIVGSIGVIMQTVSLEGTMEKLGIKSRAIKSGPMKDAGSPFRDMTSTEVAYFQQIIDGLQERFIDVVHTGRPGIPPEKLATLADGRVYTADQALQNGLVDRLGTFRDAVQAARNRAGVARANAILYARPLGWKGTVYADSPAPGNRGLSLSLLNINANGVFTSTPRFLYLWCLE